MSVNLHLSYGESQMNIEVDGDTKIIKLREDLSKKLGIEYKNIILISSEKDNKMVLSDNISLSELKSLNLDFLLGVPRIEVNFIVKNDNIIEKILLNVTLYTSFDECKKMLESKLNFKVEDNNKIENLTESENNIKLSTNKKLTDSIGHYLLEIMNEEIMFSIE
jgi:hypothetical protein